jgi:hypothetical protein
MIRPVDREQRFTPTSCSDEPKKIHPVIAFGNGKPGRSWTIFMVG